MCAVLFLDLDHFKPVNDSLGHLVGDQLLAEAARRIAGCLRPSDTVSHFGGDEFAVLVEDAHGGVFATHLAERMLHSLAAPLLLADEELTVSASIGIALGSGHARPEDLLGSADAAMYRAKAQGKGRFEVFGSAMREQTAALLHVESDLRQALLADEFVVYYQPIVSLATRQRVALEALLRWQHPERGLLTPEAFMPVAEGTSLMIEIDDWVLGAVRRQQREWERQGMGDVTVAVNVSARQLRSRELESRVAGALAAGPAQARLELDLREGVLLQDLERTVAILDRLRNLDTSLRIAVDDFGAGPSALRSLGRLPVDAFKIDHGFVGRATTSRWDAAVVSSAITLAHDMGLGVIAKGVETEQQADFLSERGCDAVQGYLTGRPMPGAAVPLST
jgi:diguanylate cyclase (GGDEF)-like protein